MPLPRTEGKKPRPSILVRYAIWGIFSMEKKCSFENYTIEQVDMGMEKNYLVVKGGCYVCRLQPCEDGWGVADYDMICQLSQEEVRRIAEFIKVIESGEPSPGDSNPGA
jgi:hypothetical protein